MEIRLDQIGDEPFRWREARSLSVESLERSQLLEPGDVGWEGEVARTSTGFMLIAKVRYAQTIECPRCLGRAPSEVEAKVELLIEPKRNEPVVGELELGCGGAYP